MNSIESMDIVADHLSPDVLQQYGALPWRRNRRGEIEILLITSRRRMRWIIPKGWPVKGRPDYLSAALEAFEEAGVIGEVYPHPIGDYHYLKNGREGLSQRCRVTLFSLHVRGTLLNWPEIGQRKRRWISLKEAAELIADPELARLVRSVGSNLRVLTKLDEAAPSVQSPEDMSGLR